MKFRTNRHSADEFTEKCIDESHKRARRDFFSLFFLVSHVDDIWLVRDYRDHGNCMRHRIAAKRSNVTNRMRSLSRLKKREDESACCEWFRIDFREFIMDFPLDQKVHATNKNFSLSTDFFERTNSYFIVACSLIMFAHTFTWWFFHLSVCIVKANRSVSAAINNSLIRAGKSCY